MKEEKLKRFAEDKVMNEAVYNEVLATFLKARVEKDVHYLAAKSLAVEFLSEAWKVLNNYKSSDVEDGRVGKQIGL